LAEEFNRVSSCTCAMAQCAIHLETRWIDQVAVVAVSGVIDVLTAPRLMEAIEQALRRAPCGLVVDMSDVEFLAPAGMTVVVATQHRLAGKRRLAVVADGPATSRPMKLIGIDSVVALHQTLDEAFLDVCPTTADLDD
jgi:anti-sigma B factor antagonist